MPFHERELAGRVALVTGGSRGIGRAVALHRSINWMITRRKRARKRSLQRVNEHAGGLRNAVSAASAACAEVPWWVFAATQGR